ncbi:hypothetical protein Taro_045875 [Colocasia esculenta]|uniref:Uncharacterized protein n=1 Tax=Colocasia esculenta TaxID=4460 RepID=A0A843X5E8_COLES|nr:hypothetical protein [Colocasia esculenta]
MCRRLVRLSDDSYLLNISGEPEDTQELVHTDSEREDTMATRGRRGIGPSRGSSSVDSGPDWSTIATPTATCGLWSIDARIGACDADSGSTAALQAQVQVQVQAPAHEAVFGGVPMMERFRRMTPPFFKRESDPILAESWLRETEKIFRTIRCTEEERETLATYMLQERADVW